MKDLQLQHDLSLLCYNNTQTAMSVKKQLRAKYEEAGKKAYLNYHKHDLVHFKTFLEEN
jgi:hypothetical protein